MSVCTFEVVKDIDIVSYMNGEDEKVLYEVKNTDIQVPDDTEEADEGDHKTYKGGRAFVTSKNFIWLPSTEGDKGIKIAFPNILMHAVFRTPTEVDTDSTADTRACLYCQLKTGNDEGALHEMRVFVEDENMLDDFYKSMCTAAEMNPDEAIEGEGDFYFNEEQMRQQNFDHMEKLAADFAAQIVDDKQEEE